MNWVGGVRNRLKTKDEKQRQKEFFEKMKYGSKVKKWRKGSPKRGHLGTSLDLLSLQAADFSSEKFRKSGHVRSSKSQVKKVELDRSRGLFPLHHRCEDLELPMSPGAPSKLQLQDSDKRNTNHPHFTEQMLTSCTPLTTPSEQMENDIYAETTGEVQKAEYSDSHQIVQSSSQFHSTPMVQEFQQAQVPRHHQGKHFEDLFFSCIPNDKDVAGQDKVPGDLSVISDEQFSEEFEYSPLSSIPSDSSATSCPIMLSPETSSVHQPRFLNEHDQVPAYLPRQVQPLQRGGPTRSSPKAPLAPRDQDITAYTISDTSNTEETWASDSSLITVCDHLSEAPRRRLPQEDPMLTMQQVDLLCEEEEDFLSPFCKPAEVMPPTRESATKISRNSPASLEIPTSISSPLVLSAVVVKTETCKEEQKQSCLAELNSFQKDSTRIVCTQANSSKWKAFVSGHALEQNPAIEYKEKPTAKAPAKVMSKMCKELLKEVLQLDNELCQHGPLLQSPISQPGAQLSTKLDMEKFSSQVTESNCNGRSAPSPDQQVPIRGSEEETGSRLLGTVGSSQPHPDGDDDHEEPLQPDTGRRDKKPEEGGTPCPAMPRGVKPERRDPLGVAETPPQQVVADGMSRAGAPDLETDPGDPGGKVCQEKATQCNILPTENRATPGDVRDDASAVWACGCDKAAARPSMPARSNPDAYDQCIIS